MTPKVFGSICVVVGTVLAILWGVSGGNMALIATLVGGAIVAVSAIALDDDDPREL